MGIPIWTTGILRRMSRNTLVAAGGLNPRRSSVMRPAVRHFTAPEIIGWVEQVDRDIDGYIDRRLKKVKKNREASKEEARKWADALGRPFAKDRMIPAGRMAAAKKSMGKGKSKDLAGK